MIRTVRLTTLICYLAIFAVRADAISLSQTIDKAAIAYEEKANFVVTITWQGNQAAYRFDRPLQPTLEKLRVGEFSTSISSVGTGASEVSTKTFNYALIPTGSGTARIEPMTIEYVSWPDSLPGELVTEAMTVSVSPAKAKAEPMSLKQVPLVALIVAWVVVIGGAGTGLLLFVRSRKRKPKEVVKTPVDGFLEKLTDLKADAGSDLKRFQTGLYKLLAWFLSAQYGIVTANKSGEEIAQAIEASQIPAGQKEKLCGWLLRADREKFSPLPPAPGETIRLETELREFFENMKRG